MRNERGDAVRALDSIKSAPNSWNLFKAPRYRGFTIRRSLLKGVCKLGRVQVSLSMNNCIKRRVYRCGKVFNLDTNACARFCTYKYIETKSISLAISFLFISSSSRFAKIFRRQSFGVFANFEFIARLRIQYSNDR